MTVVLIPSSKHNRRVLFYPIPSDIKFLKISPTTQVLKFLNNPVNVTSVVNIKSNDNEKNKTITQKSFN